MSFVFKKRRQTPEHNLQVNIIRMLRCAGFFCFAIPNGGARNVITGAKLKAEGVVAGAPDLCIVLSDGQIVFVELKAKAGRLSPAQVDFHARILKAGVSVLLWNCLKDAEDFIDKNRYLAMEKR